MRDSSPSDSWIDTRFGDLLKESVRNGIYKKKEFHGRGVKIVNMGELFAYPRLTDIEMKRVELTDEEKRNSLLENGDLIFARRSLTAEGAGKCSIVHSVNEEITFESSIIRARPNIEISNPLFLYYYFNSPYGRYLLGTILRQVAVAGITGSDLMSLVLRIPPLAEQRAIADILSSLDDKIDLLHRQNKTLESLTEALFRQQFIEEAQPDWKEGKLEDVADNIRQSVKTSGITAETRYIGLEHIDRRNIALKRYGFGADVNSNKAVFKENDILFGKLRPYFHKVVLAPFSGICSTDILVLRPKHPKYVAFCLFAFFQDDVIEYANLGSGGTRMPRTDWSALSQYEVALPDEKTLNHFNSFAMPSLEKIQKNIIQVKTLEKLRDTLLPKLMSGEVSVK